MIIRTKALLSALALVVASPALAQEIVLTVSGDVAAPAEGGDWTFTMEDLRAMPAAGFETTTIWTEGVQTFEGVALDVLLEHVGASDGKIEAIALNDYAVSIPTTDAVEGGPIIAYARDGEAMSVRDKGPLWIIYPFDDNNKYKTEEYYSRSIWQLDRLKVVAGN